MSKGYNRGYIYSRKNAAPVCCSGFVACIPNVFRLTSCTSNGSASITTDTCCISHHHNNRMQRIGSSPETVQLYNDDRFV